MTIPEPQTIDTGGPGFALALRTVIAVFGISSIAWVVVGICIHDMNSTQQTVFGGLDWVMKLTLGAIVGLVGGKAS
jgi:hypothetical protein